MRAYARRRRSLLEHYLDVVSAHPRPVVIQYPPLPFPALSYHHHPSQTTAPTGRNSPDGDMHLHIKGRALSDQFLAHSTPYRFPVTLELDLGVGGGHLSMEKGG